MYFLSSQGIFGQYLFLIGQKYSKLIPRNKIFPEKEQNAN